VPSVAVGSCRHWDAAGRRSGRSRAARAARAERDLQPAGSGGGEGSPHGSRRGQVGAGDSRPIYVAVAPAKAGAPGSEGHRCFSPAGTPLRWGDERAHPSRSSRATVRNSRARLGSRRRSGRRERRPGRRDSRAHVALDRLLRSLGGDPLVGPFLRRARPGPARGRRAARRAGGFLRRHLLHPDHAIGAVALAIAAADAGLVDEHLAVRAAVDGVGRAIGHAMRMLAMAARGRHVEMGEVLPRPRGRAATGLRGCRRRRVRNCRSRRTDSRRSGGRRSPRRCRSRRGSWPPTNTCRRRRRSPSFFDSMKLLSCWRVAMSSLRPGEQIGLAVEQPAEGVAVELDHFRLDRGADRGGARPPSISAISPT
jgi:hypothetical protein